MLNMSKISLQEVDSEGIIMPHGGIADVAYHLGKIRIMRSNITLMVCVYISHEVDKVDQISDEYMDLDQHRYAEVEKIFTCKTKVLGDKNKENGKVNVMAIQSFYIYTKETDKEKLSEIVMDLIKLSLPLIMKRIFGLKIELKSDNVCRTDSIVEGKVDYIEYA